LKSEKVLCIIENEKRQYRQTVALLSVKDYKNNRLPLPEVRDGYFYAHFFLRFNAIIATIKSPANQKQNIKKCKRDS